MRGVIPSWLNGGSPTTGFSSRAPPTGRSAGSRERSPGLAASDAGDTEGFGRRWAGLTGGVPVLR